MAAGEVHLRAGHFASAARLFLATNSVKFWRLTTSLASASSSPSSEAGETLSVEEINRQALKLAG